MLKIIFAAVAAYLLGLFVLTLVAILPPAYGQAPGAGGPDCRPEGALRMTCTYQESNGARYEMRCERRSSTDPWKCERRRAY